MKMVGLYLWLLFYPMGEPLLSDNIKIERTWFTFETIGHCEDYGNNSNWIYNFLYDNPGNDWIMAICLNPLDGERTYILPLYNVGGYEYSEDQPSEALQVITEFDRQMRTIVLPATLGITEEQVPKYKIIIKNNLDEKSIEGFDRIN